MSNDFMRIANCRGKMPVLNDIKNAYMTLSKISVELNDCPAKVLLEESKDRLWVIIDGEGYEINHNNRLVKKK